MRRAAFSSSIIHVGIALTTVLAAPVVLLLGARPVEALPAYARQTGQECAACHNGFPELTPYGRLFKLNGYTFGGGQSNLPPLAAMIVPSFTHTGTDQPGGAAPHFGPNDNLAVQSGSLFYGGAITSNIGAFAQLTYDNVARVLTWDNTDIRYANSTKLFDADTVFGVSLNNNPTVTDPWNSTPAWGYPFLSSGLAPKPAAGTLIEGGLAQQVLGLNAYALWDQLIYAEIGGYRTLSPWTDFALGVNPNGTSSIDGIAPYWRLAVEPKWERNSLEVGVFGMAARLNPGRITGFGTDHITDIGIDTQYQFLADHHAVSLQASWIAENQSLTASQALGNSTNGRDHLRSLRAKATYYYDQTYGATVAYFRVDGTSDAGLYGAVSANNSPGSSGWIGELNYMPFNHGGPEFWPWLNLKLGLQFVHYDKFNGAQTNFDGAGRNASANDTLFLYSWITF